MHMRVFPLLVAGALAGHPRNGSDECLESNSLLQQEQRPRGALARALQAINDKIDANHEEMKADVGGVRETLDETRETLDETVSPVVQAWGASNCVVLPTDYTVEFEYKGGDWGVLFVRLQKKPFDKVMSPIAYAGSSNDPFQCLIGSEHDCSNGVQAGTSECKGKYGEGADPNLYTFAFEIVSEGRQVEKGQFEKVIMKIPNGSYVEAFSSWIQPSWSYAGSAARSMVTGPAKVTQAELTIDNQNNIYTDLSSVEAYTHDLQVTATSDGQTNITKAKISSTSKDPDLQPLLVTSSIFRDKTCNYYTVLSDKWRYLKDDKSGDCSDAEKYSKCGKDPFTKGHCSDCMLASCPGWTKDKNKEFTLQGPADSVCGMHKCRQWYADKTKGKYNAWIRSQDPEFQGYGWALGEFECTDGKCGWDDTQDTPAETLTEEQCGIFYECAKKQYYIGLNDAIPPKFTGVDDPPKANLAQYSCGSKNPNGWPSFDLSKKPNTSSILIPCEETTPKDWWVSTTGCKKTEALDAPTLAAGAKFVFEFTEPAWFPTAPMPGPILDCSNDTEYEKHLVASPPENPCPTTAGVCFEGSLLDSGANKAPFACVNPPYTTELTCQCEHACNFGIAYDQAKCPEAQKEPLAEQCQGCYGKYACLASKRFYPTFTVPDAAKGGAPYCATEQDKVNFPECLCWSLEPCATTTTTTKKTTTKAR